jgi:hypothetical protein
VLKGSNLPAAIRIKNGTVNSSDLAVWQFLKDGAPNSNQRKSVETIALDLLATESFFKHVKKDVQAHYWRPQHMADREGYTLEEITTHYYECGLTESLARAIFVEYATNTVKGKPPAIHFEREIVVSTDGLGPVTKKVIKCRAAEPLAAPDPKRVHMYSESVLADETHDGPDDSDGEGDVPEPPPRPVDLVLPRIDDDILSYGGASPMGPG